MHTALLRQGGFALHVHVEVVAVVQFADELEVEPLAIALENQILDGAHVEVEADEIERQGFAVQIDLADGLDSLVGRRSAAGKRQRGVGEGRPLAAGKKPGQAGGDLRLFFGILLHGAERPGAEVLGDGHGEQDAVQVALEGRALEIAVAFEIVAAEVLLADAGVGAAGAVGHAERDRVEDGVSGSALDPGVLHRARARGLGDVEGQEPAVAGRGGLRIADRAAGGQHKDHALQRRGQVQRGCVLPVDPKRHILLIREELHTDKALRGAGDAVPVLHDRGGLGCGIAELKQGPCMPAQIPALAARGERRTAEREPGVGQQHLFVGVFLRCRERAVHQFRHLLFHRPFLLQRKGLRADRPAVAGFGFQSDLHLAGIVAETDFGGKRRGTGRCVDRVLRAVRGGPHAVRLGKVRQCLVPVLPENDIIEAERRRGTEVERGQRCAVVLGGGQLPLAHLVADEQADGVAAHREGRFAP